MSVLDGVSYSGLGGMIDRLRWADAQLRRLGHSHYIGIGLPAHESASWRDAPGEAPAAPRSERDGRPARWACFSDFADDIRALDAACRKHDRRVYVMAMFPFPSGRRGTRRHRNALANAEYLRKRAAAV